MDKKIHCSTYCCPTTGGTHENWLEHLQMLLVRFDHFGINPDIAELSLTELWGLYCFLSSRAGG